LAKSKNPPFLDEHPHGWGLFDFCFKDFSKAQIYFFERKKKIVAEGFGASTK
jgi:hypothetical protein